MRYLVVVGMLMFAAPAIADPKAIEKAVKTNLLEIANMSDDDKLAITKDAVIITERGSIVDLKEGRDGCVTGAVANAFYGCQQVGIKHVPGAVTSGTLGDLGWFQVPYVQNINGEDPDGNPVKSKARYRAGGIVIKDGKDWKIAAALYVPMMSDKDLFKTLVLDMPKGEPKLTGDTKLAAVVAGWFKTGFAPNAAKAGTLLASGTSPAEYKTAAAATKLAATWDKLKIAPYQLDAKLLAGGKVGWVVADVKLPRKGKGAVGMKLVVIVIPDGDGWRWVSMMYQPPSELG